MTCCSDSRSQGGSVCHYDELYPLMMPELPSCPRPLILQQLQRAGRTFCDNTEAWVEVLDPINIKEGVRSYELAMDWCARIIRIMEVRLRSEYDIDNDLEGTLLDPCEYDFIHYDRVTDFEDKLTLKDEPRESIRKSLVVRVALMPELYSEAIPAAFMNRWSSALIGIAMQKLLTMKNKIWTDPAKAQEYNYEYRKGWTHSLNEKERDYKDVNVSWSA